MSKKSSQQWFVLYENAENSVLHKTKVFEVVKSANAVNWTVVDDPTIKSTPEEYKDIGLVGFRWEIFSDEAISASIEKGQYHYPFLQLLKHLWPGDYNRQI